MSAPLLLLVDNGSSRPASYRRLSGYARALGERVGRHVHPVSFAHADALDALDDPTLDPGHPRTLQPFLEARLAAGDRRFVVVPLFLGPSGAITRGLARQVEGLRAAHPELEVTVADWLYRRDDPAPAVLDLLADNVRQVIEAHRLGAPPVVLCDHGSPSRAVTAVRDALAPALAKRLGGSVERVAVASMERREGPEFDFNEPLLATRLAEEGFRGRTLVLAMLFLSPGRHAGEGGDIDTLVAAAREQDPGLVVHRTRLLGEHPDLIAVLARRLEEALGSLPA